MAAQTGVTDTNVDPRPANAQPPEGGGKPEKKEPNPLEERLAKLEKELAERDKRIQELAESERYWAEQARKAAEFDDDGDDEEPEDDFGVEDDSPDKFVEELSEKGLEALVKRGVLTKREARELIREEAQRIAKQAIEAETRKLQADAEIVRQFPELQDEKSELFQHTAKIFKEMVAEDESLKHSPKALLLAARTAKAELAASGRGVGGEEDRLRRIARQGGGDHARGAAFDADDDDSLTPTQKKILEALNADGGVQVSEEAYKKRAREGVRMSTRMAMLSGNTGRTRQVGDW